MPPTNLILSQKEIASRDSRKNFFICKNCLTRIKLGFKSTRSWHLQYYMRGEKSFQSLLDKLIMCCPRTDLYLETEISGRESMNRLSKLKEKKSIRHISLEEWQRRLILAKL